MSGEEESSYQRANREISGLDSQISEWRDDALRRATADKARRGVEHVVRPEVGTQEGLDKDVVARFLASGQSGAIEVNPADYRVASTGGVVRTSHMSEYRAMGEFTGSGSLVVPTIVSQSFYEILLDEGAIWKLGPQRMTTSDGRPTNWPKLVTAGTATQTAEGGTITQSDPVFGVTSTTPLKFANITLVSRELLVDSAPQMETVLANHMGMALSQTYGTAFCSGAGGAGTIEGYMTGGSVVKQGAGTITPTGVIDLQSKINQNYRAADAKFATNDAVLAYLRSYRSSGTLATDGPWLVQMPSAPGFPETMFGSPVVIDHHIAASGSAVKEMAYGSFMRGYIVHDAGMRLEVSYDRYFDSDQVGVRAIWRLDGRVQDTHAYGIYQRTS